MKAAEIDIIDSLCKRQTLIEIINYSDEEIKRKNSVNYWFDHYIDKKFFSNNTNLYHVVKDKFDDFKKDFEKFYNEAVK